MTDLDLERLGDVWRQRPDPEELAELRRTAETVRRRAKWGQIVDAVAAVVVSGVVLLLVLSSARTDTVVVGTGAILILLVSQVRQRRLRRIELKSLTGTSEEMLDQAITRLRTALKHGRWTLIGMGPAFLIGWLVAFSASRSPVSINPFLGEGPLVRLGWSALAVALVAGAAVALAVRIRRQRRELDRLLSMRAFYREEDESDGA